MDHSVLVGVNMAVPPHTERRLHFQIRAVKSIDRAWLDVDREAYLAAATADRVELGDSQTSWAGYNLEGRQFVATTEVPPSPTPAQKVLYSRIAKLIQTGLRRRDVTHAQVVATLGHGIRLTERDLARLTDKAHKKALAE